MKCNKYGECVQRFFCTIVAYSCNAVISANCINGECSLRRGNSNIRNR